MRVRIGHDDETTREEEGKQENERERERERTKTQGYAKEARGRQQPVTAVPVIVVSGNGR